MLEKSPLMDRCRSPGFSPGLCAPAPVDEDDPLAPGTVELVLDDASVDTCPNRFLRLSIVVGRRGMAVNSEYIYSTLILLEAKPLSNRKISAHS